MPRRSARSPRVDLDRRRAWACAIAAAFGFILTALAFHPGSISADSIWQIAQERLGSYNDWHPPLMAWVWGLFERVVPGSGGIFEFQNVLFWSGLGLFGYLAGRGPLSGALATLIPGLWPPIFAQEAGVWKDVQLDAVLVFACGLIWLAATRPGTRFARRLGWVSALAFFYACALRYNAASGVLPLAIWAAWSMSRERKQVRKWALRGALILLLAFSAARGISSALVGNHRYYPEQVLLVYDLAGISARTGVMLVPKETPVQLGGAPTLEQIKERYDSGSSDPLFFWGGPGNRYAMMHWKADIDRLLRAWEGAVLEYPGAYLAHRSAIFRSLLGIGSAPVQDPYFFGVARNVIGVQGDDSRPAPWIKSVFARLGPTPLFRAWIYFGVLLFGTLWAIFGPMQGAERAVALALGFSGLLYELPYFFIVSGSVFRYSDWMVLSTMLLAVVIVTGASRELRYSR